MKKASEIIEVTIEAPCGINSQTGKSEEIEILNRITNRFRGTQTYLDSLFTTDLLDYFSGKVKDDFCPDIMAEYVAEQETNRTLAAELAAAKTQIECRDNDYNRLKELAKDELSGKNNMIDRLTSTVSDLQRRYAEQGSDKFAAARDRDALAEQVRDLKVMLFDLQNKKAA